MFIEIHPDEAAFLDRVRQFVAEEVLPCTREWERNAAFPDDIWPRLGEVGLLAMTLPLAKGGLGASCTTYCQAIKEVAKGDPALAMNLSAINALCTAHFDRFATPEQCEKYLPGVVSGKIKMAWGLTEPDAGSDARRVKTSATPIADRPSYFRLNGRPYRNRRPGFRK